MLFIITGSIGIGKSTVCRGVIDFVHKAGYACGGVITSKSSDGSIIVENVQNGQRMILAGVNGTYEGPRVGKYTFNPKGLEFGIDAINKGRNLSLLVVDEIGPLELEGKGFHDVVDLVNNLVTGIQLLVIRKELLSSFLPKFDKQSKIFKTTSDNRDLLSLQIGRSIILGLT